MRVFLDECVDWRLSRDIAGHDVRTAHDMGWDGIRNGELLRQAAQQFDVFITVDRNLAFQQNVSPLNIAVIVLRSRSNRLADLRALLSNLLSTIATARPGTIQFVDNAPTR